MGEASTPSPDSGNQHKQRMMMMMMSMTRSDQQDQLRTAEKKYHINHPDDHLANHLTGVYGTLARKHINQVKYTKSYRDTWSWSSYTYNGPAHSTARPTTRTQHTARIIADRRPHLTTTRLPLVSSGALPLAVHPGAPPRCPPEPELLFLLLNSARVPDPSTRPYRAMLPPSAARAADPDPVGRLQVVKRVQSRLPLLLHSLRPEQTALCSAPYPIPARPHFALSHTLPNPIHVGPS